MPYVSNFNLLDQNIEVLDVSTVRRFVLIGDSNSTPADYNGNITALSMFRDYLQSGKNPRYSLSAFNAVSGIGYTTTPSFTDQIPTDADVTDIVAVGGGNDVGSSVSVVDAILTFIDTALTKCPKLKRIYFIWIANSVGRPVYNSYAVKAAFRDAIFGARNLCACFYNDISPAASNVTDTLSVDNFHYNMSGQKLLFPALMGCVLGGGYQPILVPYDVPMEAGTTPLFYEAGTNNPMETTYTNAYICWKPDGSVRGGVVFSGTPPYVQQMDMKIPTRYARMDGLTEYAMATAYFRCVASQTTIAMGVEKISVDRQFLRLRFYPNLQSFMTQETNWRMFFSV